MNDKTAATASEALHDWEAMAGPRATPPEGNAFIDGFNASREGLRQELAEARQLFSLEAQRVTELLHERVSLEGALKVANEALTLAADVITNACQIIDVTKIEWGEAWSDWDQMVRDTASVWLQEFHRKAALGASQSPTKTSQFDSGMSGYIRSKPPGAKGTSPIKED